MAHVELSLSDERGPGQSDPHGPSSVRHWAEAVARAGEPCVVLDADGVIVSISPSCLALLGGHAGGPEPQDGESWIGRGLLDVLHLVDLTADGAQLAAWESERVPPLLALSSGSLARGVMRIRLGNGTRTLDAVSTPLRDDSTIAGSLTFLSRI
jgi:hypothetical protein